MVDLLKDTQNCPCPLTQCYAYEAICGSDVEKGTSKLTTNIE